MPYSVYALIDPRTSAVFYIGITNSVNERLKQHINYQDTNAEKHAWIQRLKEENLVPSMEVLETAKNRMTAVEREEYWIHYYLEQGVQLTNRQLYLVKHIKREVGRTQQQECGAVKQRDREKEHVTSKKIKTPFYTTKKTMEKEYYKPEEVMKLLGISKATLNRRAEDGTIPSELEEGRKRGRKYPKEAIDAHVKLLKRKDNAKLTFGPATNSELWASYQNHFRLYEPEDIVTYDRLLEWREANYDIFMSAREGGKRIAGVTIMPLEENVIKSIINEEIREQNIQPEAIREWTDKNLMVYIPSISIHHTGDAQKDKDRGRFIIRNAIRWAISLDRQYDIKKWYAVAATPEGRKLVEHLGFEKIAGKRDAYLLTDLKKATKPIKAFIDRLEEESEPLVPPPKQQ